MTNELTITQNFLQDKKQINRILKRSDLSKNDLIIDIGVGKGIISESLLENGYKVLGFELDLKLSEYIGSNLKNPNFKLRSEDFLDFDLAKLKDVSFSIFSNIPFNQTTNIIQKILIRNSQVNQAYLIIQEEAANRFLGKNEGLLQSLIIKNNFETEVIYKFKKSDFYPVPKVNIVLVKFSKRKLPLIAPDKFSEFLDFISYLIIQQKPTILDRLSKTNNYHALREFFKESNVSSFKSLYQIPGDKYFEMFSLFYKKFPTKTKIFENSYQNYLKINLKNKKIFKTRFK
jgi:23S rRNA (adenine-N6)-dimethyltransferase